MRPVFIIRPYVGVGELRFGMTVDAVTEIIGPATRTIRDRSGELEEYRLGIKVCYEESNQTVSDFVLFPPAEAVYGDIDLLKLEDPTTVLVKDDPEPRGGMGIVVFLKLGISLTGFGEVDTSDRSISVFSEGHWDSLCDQLRPLVE